jgi:hypothetical protein
MDVLGSATGTDELASVVNDVIDQLDTEEEGGDGRVHGWTTGAQLVDVVGAR